MNFGLGVVMESYSLDAYHSMLELGGGFLFLLSYILPHQVKHNLEVPLLSLYLVFIWSAPSQP
jgi:hypothetical protein